MAEKAEGTPGWVKVFGAVILLLILLFVILRVTGVGGQHGPSRHARLGETTTTGDPRGEPLRFVVTIANRTPLSV